MRARQSGFTLIAAIFLLVVVAALVVYISNIRTVQQITLVYGVQGARAHQAARAGLEWGIASSIAAGTCPATTTFTLPDAGLSAFSINVNCSESAHTEGDIANTINTYRVTSVASSGTFGTLDYIERRMRATVSLDPP